MSLRVPRIKHFSWLYPYIRAKKGFTASIGSLIAASVACGLARPTISGRIVDQVVDQASLSTISLSLVVLGGIMATERIAIWAKDRLTIRCEQTILMEIRKDLLHHILHLSSSFLDRCKVGYLMGRVGGDVENLSMLVSDKAFFMLVYVATIILGSLLLIAHSTKLFIVVVASIPIVFVMIRRACRAAWKLSYSAMEHRSQATSGLQSIFASVRLIKATLMEHSETKKVGDKLDSARLHSVTHSDAEKYADLVAGGVNDLVILLVMVIGVYEAYRQNISIGNYVASIAYAVQVLGAARYLALLQVYLQPSMVALERVAELNGVVREDDGDETRHDAGRLSGAVEFENVQLQYRDGRCGLRGISLAISPGEKIVVMGETGSGKTSLLNMIMRLYHPTGGRIKYDNRDAGTLTIRSVRKNISFMPQKEFLLRDTVFNNIRNRHVKATPDEVAFAATRACARGFIEELPDGYETSIGEGNLALSLGQAQRVAIARCLLGDEPILLLDEPTSALDRVTESMIVNTIFSAHYHRTVVFVTHRSNIAERADRIIILKDGVIAETGSHAELVHAKRIYSSLV